jgi:hypothetical protein
MNKTLDNYLCEKYPRIFIERSMTPRESCMGRGFECGNGWFPLIDSLCYNIQEYIDGHNKYRKAETPIEQVVFLRPGVANNMRHCVSKVTPPSGSLECPS